MHPLWNAKQPAPLEVPLPFKLLLDYDIEDQTDTITPVGSDDLVEEMCFSRNGSDVQVAVAPGPILTTPGLEHSRSQDPYRIEHPLASQVVPPTAKDMIESGAAANVKGLTLIPQHGVNACAWLGMDASAGEQQAASQVCCEIAAKNGNELLACNQWKPQFMEASMVKHGYTIYGWGATESPAWQEHSYPDWHEQTLSKACIEALQEVRDRNAIFLKNMTSKEANRVLLLRKIQHLGLESPIYVRQHFEQYGVVEDVFICHNPGGYRRNTGIFRFRPATRGLVLMSTAEEATNILNMGCEQIIAGRTVIVQRYEMCKRF